MRRNAPKFLVLAMDMGSSSIRSAFFADKGRVLSETRASGEYAIRYIADGGAELSPALVLGASRKCVRKTLAARRASPSLRNIPIVAAGGSAFWHSLLGLDGEGRPLTPIFTWADSRSTPDAARFRDELDEREVHAQTGCMLRASFWPAKLRWLLRTEPRLFRRVVRWVSPGDWIFSELFGAAGCSHSMASATGLYDLHAKRWHAGLCKASGLNANQLSALTEVAARDGSGFRELAEAKIFCAIGDGAAGNLGCGASARGVVAINVGTSAAVRTMTTEERSGTPFGLFRYAVDGERSVLGGAVSNAGNLRRWCLRELRLTESASNKALSRAAAAEDEITVLPFWVGDRAPTWPENLSGVMTGLSQATDAAQIHRATMSAAFYRLGQILALIEGAAGPARKLIVSGGILHSTASLRLLADTLGRNLCVSSEPEASLRGAAVYVLERLGGTAAPPRKGKIVRYDRALARKHRIRRERQVALEQLLSKNLKP